MTSPQPIGKRLPYWTSRTLDVPNGELALLVMKDGTICAGYRVEGVDVFCSPTAELNRIARVTRDALTVLPPDAYVQTRFESGLSWDRSIKAYEAEDNVQAHPILREARRRRAEQMRSDGALTRTRLTYYIGLRQAFGALLPHATKPKGLFRSRLHPTEVTAQALLRAGDRLQNTMRTFATALVGAGVKFTPLSERELLDDAHEALNPSSRDLFGAPTSTIVETREDVEGARRGARVLFRGPNLASQLPLAAVHFAPDHIVTDDPPVYERLIGVHRYPFATDPATLFPLQYRYLPLTRTVITTVHLATDAQLRKEQLERRRNLLQAGLARKTVDHEAKAAYHEYEQLLQTLATSDSRIFETQLFVTVSGSDLRELDEATRLVRQGFSEAQFTASVLTSQQFYAWAATLPGNAYRAPRPYPVLTENCANLTPIFQPAPGTDVADFLFTTRQRSVRRLSWRQSGARDNVNTFIIGSTGSGKTFLFSHLLKTTQAIGGHVVVADTKGPVNSTYRPMAELLGGQYVALHAVDHTVAFNPCPEPRQVRAVDGKWLDGLDQLRDIVAMMTVPDFDQSPDRDLWKSIATDVIKATYMRVDDRTPLLQDVHASFSNYSAQAKDFGPMAQKMAIRLNLWLQDRRRGALLNRQTTKTSENPFQVFDFFGLQDDKELAAVLISTLSSRLYGKMQTLPLSTPKLFHFDEAWAFFDHSELSAALVGSLFRVARSYGAAITVASQSYSDVAESRAAKAMMANASIYVLLRHNAQHEDVARVFNLQARELELFRNLQFRPGEYSEFLYLDRHNNESALLRYAPTPYELWIDTSRAIDMEVRALVFARKKDPVDALKYLADKYPRGATEGGLKYERERAQQRREAAG